MANKKKTNYKKAAKTAKKVAKKTPKTVLIIIIVLVVVGALAVAGYWFFVLRNRGGAPSSSSEPTSSEILSSEESHSHSSECSSSEHHSHSSESIITKSMSINFLELGNRYTGDSTYIKAGDVDILIDAGSRQSSAKTIKDFINQYCEDGKLEYVIATHAHQDHIAGFVGTTTEAGIFESYKIGTLIDFALTDVTSQLYGKYSTKRDAALANGDMEHHYTAAECIKGENGAQKEYTIADGITMTILDQKFYYEHSSDENNYSVCTLFTQGENNYLFTGDLEKAGEASLVEMNTLPHVQLFKGGHHGSYTSNTETLLSVITPEVVCFCCCAGQDEYTTVKENQFPSQTAINNIAKYTDKIYVTTVSPDGHSEFESMNGNITFLCNDGVNYIVTGSNNSKILKEQEWFINNRTWPEGGV